MPGNNIVDFHPPTVGDRNFTFMDTGITHNPEN